MQEAWCRSWWQCVQTLPLHTRPLPHQVVPSEHFCVGSNSCWTVALTHPGSLNDPEAQILRCTGAASAVRGDGRVCRRAGSGSEEQRLLQTPDLVVLLIPCLLRNAPTVGCVCLFVSILWKFFIQTSFHLLGKERIDFLKSGSSSLLLCSEGTPLDCCHRVCIPQRGVMGRVWGSHLFRWPQTSFSLDDV